MKKYALLRAKNIDIIQTKTMKKPKTQKNVL